VEEGVSILSRDVSAVREHSYLRSDLTPFEIYIKFLTEYFGSCGRAHVLNATKTFSKKSTLFTRLLPALKEQSAYFSLAAVKRALTEADIELADDTLREYMSEAMATGIVTDAGRGWYSRHQQPVSLDPKPVTKIIEEYSDVYAFLGHFTGMDDAK